jgi:hypothetical protein
VRAPVTSKRPTLDRVAAHGHRRKTLEPRDCCDVPAPSELGQTSAVKLKRPTALVLVSASFATSCASASRTTSSNSPHGGATLRAILGRPGPNVALVPGSSDFSVGLIRVSFLVLRRNGAAVSRPVARVWVATSLDAKPIVRTSAALEPIGVPGGSFGYDLQIPGLYVARLSVPKAGKFLVLAEPVGGRPIQALATILVKRVTASPPIGSNAFPSRTPTLAGEKGNLAKLTTRVPPDTALIRYSVADSLAAHKAVRTRLRDAEVCQSRTCGPVVDVVDTVRRRFVGTNIRFIHVEIYKNNDPSQGPNRWVKEWRLPSEPWTFLVGQDGRIKAKFEGSESVAELSSAVRRYLVSPHSG